MNSSGSVAISNGQLVLASLLILVNVLLSVVLQLGLARSLILASARTIVQLLLVGHLPVAVQQDNALLILGVSLVMAAIAGVTSVQRSRRRFPGIYWNSVLSVLASRLIARVGLDRHHPTCPLVRRAIPDPSAGHGAGQHVERRFPRARPPD